MRSFASDNNSSVHPRIMEALMKTNNGHALGYGDDPWTEEATHKVQHHSDALRYASNLLWKNLPNCK